MVASAQDTDWTGATSTDWFQPLNWTNGVPGVTSEAIIDTLIPNGAVISVPGAIADDLFVSNGNDAVLTVTGAGTLQTDTLAVNDGTTGLGVLNVGNGASVVATINLNVAQAGAGELNITGGATVSSAQVSIASDVGVIGTINVDGPGSEILKTDVTNNNVFSVGFEGNGFLNVTNGGRAISEGPTTVGALGPSVGTVVVDGDGSLLRAGTGLTVGNVGTGMFTVRNGGTLQSGGAIVGAFNNPPGFPGVGDGTVVITGASSQWINSSSSPNALLAIGAEGNGRVRVEDGGLLASFTQTQLGRSVGSTGSLTIDGVNSGVGLVRTIFVGVEGDGRIDVVNGGRLTTGLAGSTSGQTVRIGDIAGVNGVVRVSGANSLWSNLLPVAVGNSGAGAIEIVDGGRLEFAGGLSLARESGSSGTILIDGPGSSMEEVVDDAILHRLGRNGTSVFTISNGGNATFLNDLFLGDDPGANSTLTVTGAGSSLVLGDGIVLVEGTTRVAILDGATLTAQGSLGFGLGSSTGSHTMVIRGAGTTATFNDLISVGRNPGMSVLEVTDGAQLTTTSFIFAGSDPASVSTLLFDGANTRVVTGGGLTWQ